MARTNFQRTNGDHGRNNGARRHAPLGIVERVASAGAGGALLAAAFRTGVRSRQLPMMAGGGYLIYRALSGHCVLSESVGLRRTRPGVESDVAITIERPAEEVYSYWRDFENLPRFMDHLESVRIKADGRSHWVAHGPAGMRVEWEAEMTKDVPNREIAWRSLTGSKPENEGRVAFTPRDNGRATEVRLSMRYHPTAGIVGAAVAKILGEEPGQQIERDMRRFKQVLETGEAATTEGQSSGRPGNGQEVRP